MKENSDYSSVPHGFIYCLNTLCPHAQTCLRYQVALHIQPECNYIDIVNPKYTVPDNEACRFFIPDKLIRFARGITHLLDNIPHSDAVEIKQQMLDHFGKTLYYRFWRKERLINPSQQSYIQQLFRKQGIKEEPVYEEFLDQYDW